LPVDTVRLKARRHCYITAARLRQVGKRRTVACLSAPLPFRPRILPQPPATVTPDVVIAECGPQVGDPPTARAAERDGPPACPWATALRHTSPGRGAAQARRHRRRRAAPSAPAGMPLADPDEVLVLVLHNYRIMACRGTDRGALQASPMAVDTGAGPSLIRHDALAPNWRAHVTPQPATATLRLQDSNNRCLVTSGHIVLWFQAGGRLVSHGFLVVDDLSVDVILECHFLDEHAHAILPPDRRIRWCDRSATAILRGHPMGGTRAAV